LSIRSQAGGSLTFCRCSMTNLLAAGCPLWRSRHGLRQFLYFDLPFFLLCRTGRNSPIFVSVPLFCNSHLVLYPLPTESFRLSTSSRSFNQSTNCIILSLFSGSELTRSFDIILCTERTTMELCFPLLSVLFSLISFPPLFQWAKTVRAGLTAPFRPFPCLFSAGRR